MTTIFSRHRLSGLAAVMLAGSVLGACAGPATNGPALHAENMSPNVMSDAVLSAYVSPGLGSGEACVPDTQTFAADCGGFVHYEGP